MDSSLPLARRNAKIFSFLGRRKHHTDSADSTLTPCRGRIFCAGRPPPGPRWPRQWYPASRPVQHQRHERDGGGGWVHLSKPWPLTLRGIGCASKSLGTHSTALWQVTNYISRMIPFHHNAPPPLSSTCKWGDLFLQSCPGSTASCTCRWDHPRVSQNLRNWGIACVRKSLGTQSTALRQVINYPSRMRPLNHNAPPPLLSTCKRGDLLLRSCPGSMVSCTCHWDRPGGAKRTKFSTGARWCSLWMNLWNEHHSCVLCLTFYGWRICCEFFGTRFSRDLLDISSLNASACSPNVSSRTTSTSTCCCCQRRIAWSSNLWRSRRFHSWHISIDILLISCLWDPD